MSSRLLFILPVVVFAGLVAVFLAALQRDDIGEIPSVLIGTEVRPFEMRALSSASSDEPSVVGLSDQDLKQGGVSVVNFWASWCGPCEIEHPQLMALAQRDDITLFGVNYKDKDDKARAFLEELGDPFRQVGVDDDGRVGIDWGLTGVPETFVVDGTGRIVMKHIGPLTPADIENVVLPAVRAAAR